jgi:fused signal recognition particle receptor
MFSFFRKKPAAVPAPPQLPAAPAAPEQTPAQPPADAPVSAPTAWGKVTGWVAPWTARDASPPATATTPAATAAATSATSPDATPAAPVPLPPAEPVLPQPDRGGWMGRLKQGLRKTGGSLTQVFTGTRIDEALYEDLEAALLQADAGVAATQFLLDDLRRRVKASKATEPAAVRALLVDALTDLLRPLQQALVIGRPSTAAQAQGKMPGDVPATQAAAEPTVIMVAGVNGAGKTTTIGKLTRHLAAADCKVLLAAADTFRAAAREQLAVWADRNRVEIVAQAGGDPAAVTFDAVNAGRARGCDVVIADTAGRLPTQLHLMAELEKIRRTIAKAQAGAPHEVLLVVDGNTGQNALTQVQAFDKALQLTGLVVTKLDGTAKGGVLAAIARWGAQQGRVVPVYFIGIGEKLEDLQTFDAREFAQALLG